MKFVLEKEDGEEEHFVHLIIMNRFGFQEI